jgi:hypothetical protein
MSTHFIAPYFMLSLTFTSTERLWDPFIKDLHTLHASKLNISNKIENL